MQFADKKSPGASSNHPRLGKKPDFLMRHRIPFPVLSQWRDVRSLDRLVRSLVNAVVLFGVGLALIGLMGSLGQFVQGMVDIFGPNAGLGIDGAQVTQADKGIPPTGSGGQLRAPPVVWVTPTPFQPFAPTASPKPGGWPTETPAPPTATPPATPSPTPRPIGSPDRIVIDKIGLDAPVVISPRLELKVGQDVFEHWDPPNYFAAGWSEGSAMLGEKGNTVLSGHHNIDGMVFGHLLDLAYGDRITVYSGQHVYHYVVAQAMKFEERDAPIAQRVENGRWLAPSDDERLTLVTCWPPDSNTYRLIIVAVPAN